jgi:branched-subunit amino acid transport protein
MRPVAILAGVIAQILVTPPGALASVPDWLRYAAAAGFAAFVAARRSTLVGVVCGEIVMLAGKWWLG